MSLHSLRPEYDRGGNPAPAGWIRDLGHEREGPRFRGLVRDGWWLVVLALLLSVGGAMAYLYTADKVYEARAELLVTPVPDSADLPLSLGLLRESADPTRNLETVARLVTTTPVAVRARNALGLPNSVRSLLDRVEAQPVAQSDLVAVTATAPSARGAERLADGFANALVAERTERMRAALDTILPPLRRSLGRIRREARATSPLADKIRELDGLRGDPTVRLETPADLPTRPVSPRPALTIAAAVVAGLVVGFGAVFALALLDPRLRREEQLRQRFDLPVLARIPRQRRWRRRRRPLKTGDLTPAGLNGFRGLHTALDGRRARQPDPSSRTVLITGPSGGDGKTTTALNLAASLSAGGESVVLIDADLRRPSLDHAFGVEATRGLVDVAGGTAEFEESLQPTGSGNGDLRLLAAGQRARLIAPNVLSPATARDVVHSAQCFNRSVVIDTPPLNRVPDVLAFVGTVDDVVIAVRLGRTNLRELQDLAELLAHQGVTPAGFVIAGVSGRDYYYDYA